MFKRKVILALLFSSNIYGATFSEQKNEVIKNSQLALLHSQEKVETLSCYLLPLLPAVTEIALNEIQGYYYDEYLTSLAHIPLLLTWAKSVHTKHTLYKKHEENLLVLSLKLLHASIPLIIQYSSITSSNENAATLNVLLAAATAFCYMGYNSYKQYLEKK